MGLISVRNSVSKVIAFHPASCNGLVCVSNSCLKNFSRSIIEFIKPQRQSLNAYDEYIVRDVGLSHHGLKLTSRPSL